MQFKYETVILLLFCMKIPLVAQPANVVEQDSLFNETAMRDSSLARAIEIKQYKPLSFIKTEKQLKYQLIKLVLYSDGRYINFYQPTELMFEEVDRYSERTKKRMLFLTLGGGVASQAMMYSRKFLRQKNIDFITPNLSGLNIYSKPLPLQSKAMFRVAGINDFYFATNIKSNKFTITQRSTSYYLSRGVYWRFYKSFRFLYSNTKCSYTTYHNYGFTYYSKWLSLYWVYQKNFENDKWNRFYIDWEIRI